MYMWQPCRCVCVSVKCGGLCLGAPRRLTFAQKEDTPTKAAITETSLEIAILPDHYAQSMQQVPPISIEVWQGNLLLEIAWRREEQEATAAGSGSSRNFGFCLLPINNRRFIRRKTKRHRKSRLIIRISKTIQREMSWVCDTRSPFFILFLFICNTLCVADALLDLFSHSFPILCI
jgi:hypothetical protein